jgi:hypothetical protein
VGKVGTGDNFPVSRQQLETGYGNDLVLEAGQICISICHTAVNFSEGNLRDQHGGSDDNSFHGLS